MVTDTEPTMGESSMGDAPIAMVKLPGGTSDSQEYEIERGTKDGIRVDSTTEELRDEV
jgi:hypothetical protein